MDRSSYEGLMDCVSFMIEHMAVLRKMAEETSDKPLALQIKNKSDQVEGWAVLVQLLAMEAVKGGSNGAGTPKDPSDDK